MSSIIAEVRAPRVTKFTNCRVLSGTQLVEQDLWIDSVFGKILQDQEAFYEYNISPDQVIDLGGRILAPGFIDVQLNGAYGFDFSTPKPTREQYDEGLRLVNRALANTGVTSYLPTLTSQLPDVYAKVLPLLAPSGAFRRAEDGAESLGAHVEGPFLSLGKNGIHSPEVLRSVQTGIQDLTDCYGAENLPPPDAPGPHSTPIKMLTAAPEVGHMLSLIPAIRARNIIFSIGHSDATYEQAMAALSAGASMITHLFNAMGPFTHRHPGVFGLLGQSERPRPFYGVIADGIHLHPTTIKIAFNSHPSGLVLVTDAMMLCGMPDGVYDWTNGERIVKRGELLTLEGSDRIAGSSVTMIECVNNFRRWTGAQTAEALAAATETPARMLGVLGVKGSLSAGADADLVVLGEQADEAGTVATLTVDQVWKFGEKIFDRGED